MHAFLYYVVQKHKDPYECYSNRHTVVPSSVDGKADMLLILIAGNYVLQKLCVTYLHYIYTRCCGIYLIQELLRCRLIQRDNTNSLSFFKKRRQIENCETHVVGISVLEDGHALF